jgi:hypothetical protein
MQRFHQLYLHCCRISIHHKATNNYPAQATQDSHRSPPGLQLWHLFYDFDQQLRLQNSHKATAGQQRLQQKLNQDHNNVPTCAAAVALLAVTSNSSCACTATRPLLASSGCSTKRIPNNVLT